MHFEGKCGRIVYRIVQPGDEISDSAKAILAEKRKFNPPISYEQMKIELETQIIIYALEKLRDEGLITEQMYYNAVNIAYKKEAERFKESGIQRRNR